MQLQLDPQEMRAAMDLWRQELGPGHGAQVVQLRGTIAGWLDLLRLCTPAPEAAGELQAIVADVLQFQAWLQEAEQALDLLRGSTTPAKGANA